MKTIAKTNEKLSIKFLDKEPEIYQKLNFKKATETRNQLVCRWIPSGQEYPKMIAIWVSIPPDD